ncbi:hypothetical protein [Alcanivorax sp.]|jgi:chemotaxis protein histidine kinase CheA|uniref:hypothetical protein n=1 Tax=Alcanivorax sp. TaxID=1872427 RepID=UPI000C5CFA83|nr:hypothetical protein [Alcanivorax sp.]MBU86279.1 hypothetical protein [Alcanivorax sp.]
MTHRLLAAAALMLVTTSISWANTEGVPNVKTPDPEKVTAQMEDTLEEIQAFTVEQKNDAMRAARHALDDLDRQITLLQSEIDSRWQGLSQQARLDKQSAMATLKEQRAELESRYQALQQASADNWEAAKVKFSRGWDAVKQSWQALNAPVTESTENPEGN